MKKKLLILIIILISFGSMTTLFSNNALVWHDFNEGYKLSVESGKPMVVDFYADWCSWCKVMDEKTFADPTIKKLLNDNFILVRIDVEKQSEITYKEKTYQTREFQAAMQVTGLPTLAFFDKKGEFITTLPGYVDAEKFRPVLTYISSECYNKNVAFQEYLTANEQCLKK